MIKLNVNLSAILILGAAVGVGWTAYLAAKEVREAIDKLKISDETFNPASTENGIYRLVNGLGAMITGNENWNLGVAIYEAIHGEDEELRQVIESYNWLEGAPVDDPTYWPGI
jgi:hypothetical protein